MKKAMSLAAFLIVVIVAGLMGYVRFAPVNGNDWHIDLVHRPAEIADVSLEVVYRLSNGAYVDLPQPAAEARITLGRLDAVALATPRTLRVAGSVEEGHITWVTRSRLWAFPDYTTAQITPMGLTVFARQRYGSQDSGVNAARLSDWLARL